MIAPLRRLQSAARRRRSAQVLAVGLPWAIAGFAAWRAFSPATAWVAAVALLSAIAWRIAAARRGIDQAWLVHRLDADDRALEDSADLLFADPATLPAVARLQRERVLRVLQGRATRELHEPWPRRRIAWACGAAILVLAALMAWPLASPRAPSPPPRALAAPAIPAAQALIAHLRVVPPPYTGLPARELQTLSARVEEGGTLEWSLRFVHAPQRARLVFVDGQRLELTATQGTWKASRTLARSTLYRVEVEGAAPLPATPSARLEVIPDRAPRLTVLQPERTLTVATEGLRQWAIVVEANDDYGLAGAQLDVMLAQGSGEQVTVTQRRLALAGQGDAKRRRYEHRVDLAALGFAAGDDVIAALQVRDNRTPEANLARSPSFILRWPPPAAQEGSGVEGLVQKAMPAYFRSQRQIIIDTEALIAQRQVLAADDFLAKSDTIGADQRLLRLRYGQFLGEESEVAGEAHADSPGAPPGDSTRELMAEAGHLHDLPEAATLLDPGTRALLREALAAMWEAERELRTGAPVAALPHERRALEFIKRAQQADRIYLARVGLDLPVLDAARRLTGERGVLAGRRDPAAPAPSARVPEAAWTALQAGALPDLAPLSAWAARLPDAAPDAMSEVAPDTLVATPDATTRAALDAATAPTSVATIGAMTDARAEAATASTIAATTDATTGVASPATVTAPVRDPLALLEAIDALQRDAQCVACRDALARALWPALTPPAAAPLPRAKPDAVGEAYLDALATPEQTP